MSTAAALARGALIRLAWLVAAAVIAAGSAGIVAGVGGPPSVVPRPELTWRGDRAIEPGFAVALADLEALAQQVDRLGTLGRAALAALSGRDQGRLASAITDGSALVGEIDDHVGAIRGRLRSLPGIGGLAPPLPPTAALTLGADVQARYGALDRALDASSGLSDAWVRLTAGSLAAIRLTSVLAEHDTSTAAAARMGRGGRYSAALEQLATSRRLLGDASKQRDTLANTVDVTTLTRWIDLNAAYDKALRALYDALRKSNGRATTAVRQALAAEAAAHSQLPPDTRGLVVIMGEIARGGMNQAVIGIEQARGDLDAAIDELSAGSAPSSGPAPATVGPAPTVGPAATVGPPPTPTFLPIVTPAPTA